MKREAASCPYRKPVLGAPPGQPADACGILARLSGVAIGHPLLRVTRANCDYCCSEPVVASPTTLNPGVASYLFELSCGILSAGGVDGCSPASARELRELATRHLRHGSRDQQPYRSPKYDRPCTYLGAPTGNITAGGETTSACHHEFHGPATTVAVCKTCHDYDPVLVQPGPVGSWATGVTTAPRRTPTLARTLESLAEAGWTGPTIFAEPQSRIPNTYRHLKIVRRPERLGAWPNFLLGLTELLLTRPDADAYLMVQDDTLFCRRTRQYLEAELWPHPRTGVVSLHTPSHHVPEDEATRGFFPRKVGWGAWGAMAFIFSNSSARAMLRHPAVVNHRSRGIGGGLRNVDSVVGHWCHLAGLEFYLHRPSLTQHIGLTTTLWSRDSLEGRRSAADFPGEDFDAGKLTKI